MNRYLTRDLYAGALTDLNLTTNPWNNNRYAFAGGNPITGIELDGHRITECDGPCAPGDPGQWENPVTGQIQGKSAFDISVDYITDEIQRNVDSSEAIAIRLLTTDCRDFVSA